MADQESFPEIPIDITTLALSDSGRIKAPCIFDYSYFEGNVNFGNLPECEEPFLERWVDHHATHLGKHAPISADLGCHFFGCNIPPSSIICESSNSRWFDFWKDQFRHAWQHIEQNEIMGHKALLRLLQAHKVLPSSLSDETIDDIVSEIVDYGDAKEYRCGNDGNGMYSDFEFGAINARDRDRDRILVGTGGADIRESEFVHTSVG